MYVRLARPGDLPALREIEWAAGECFRDIGMPEIADDEPLSLAELGRYEGAGSAWLTVDGAGAPLAYLIADLVDGNVHVEQVSVHPRGARRGVGRALIDHVASGATTPAITLTTFVAVPWNAPYYERCGFRVLAGAEATPGLRAIRRREAEQGLDRWPRVCMRRDL